MSTSIEQHQLRFIPVERLSLSPLNVRKTGAESGIEELAALIRSQGVLQNLTVYEERKQGRQGMTTYPVVAGGRRWRALQLLVKQEHITPTYEVPCLVTTYERAVEISLAENSGRQDMHPADQFEAFHRLVDTGQSVEDVAARFGVTPLVVQRRLKLANVAPEFITVYREGEITLEHLMAFAVTDDHAKQQQVWKGLKPYERHPSALRRALTENEVSARERVARFVGLKAYEKAGGAIRRDLFAEDGDAFILDPALLSRLATEKLEKRAAQLKAEGLAWVDVTPHLDYAGRAEYGRVRTILREPTEQEQAQLDALIVRQAEIEAKAAEAQEAQDDDRLAELADQADEIDAEMDVIREQRTIPHPDQQSLAGAVVSIGHDGKVRIEGGLLKPEDAKRFARTRSADKSGEQEARTHSAALIRRLTAHRTLALQATLAQRPDIALVALAHRLVLRTYFEYGMARDSVVQIEAKEAALLQHAPDLGESRAHATLEARRNALRAALPQDPDVLLAWLLDQPQTDVLSLVAFCVAVTVDGVQSDEGPSPADGLARAAGLDMHEWWTPTADNYLGSIPKARILEVVREAVSAEAAAALAKLKRAPLAKAAEERLAGTGWLPPVLRTATA